MAVTLPGYKIFEYVIPATVALSPIVSGWIDTTGFTSVFPFFLFTNSTGTTVVTAEGTSDNTNPVAADADFAYSAITTVTAFPVISPFIRFRIVQATADATRTKIFMQARA